MATPRSVWEEHLALGSFGFAVVAVLTSNVLYAFDVAYFPVRYGLEIGATLACCTCIVVVFVRHHIERRALLITLAGITCIGVAKLLDVAAIESRGMELTGMTRDVFARAVTNSFVGPGLILLLLSFLLVMITSSHHANEAVEQGRRLQESEGRLRAVVETAADGIITIDAEGTITSLNRAAMNIFGYREDELIGRNVALLMPSPDRERHDGFIEAYLRTGVKKIIGTGREVIGQRKDGSRFPVGLAVSETRIQGRPTFTGIVRDITERKRAEEALRESEERFDLAARGSRDGLWDWNVLTDRAWCSARYYELLGLEHNEVEATFAWWEGRLHPDDKKSVLEAIRAHLEDRVPFDATYRLREKSGAYRWFLARGQAVWDETGRATRMAGSIQDITERHQAEQALRESDERFRQLAEHIEDVFYLVNVAPYAMLYVSPAFEEVWGIPREMLAASPTAWLDRVHPDDRDRVRAGLSESSSWKGEVSIEYRVVRPDQSVRWIRDRGFPIVNDAGQTYRLAGIAADITDLKQAEAALRRSNEELERANERLSQEMAERSRAEERARQHQDELAHVARLSTMGEMAAGLAHELNQPLAAIQNYTGACERMLRSGTTDSPRLLEGMVRASAECQRAATIIRRLRSFIRCQRPQLSAFDINHLARDTAEFLAHDLRQSHVAVQLELDPAVPAVIGDTIQIEQVILNLMRNALEAMAHTPIDARRILIRTAPVAARMVEVAVSDAGCGLPAEGGDRLFDLFVTTKPDGMGLGLGISRSIIEAHHGRLWAAANGDAGATFRFTLPFATPNP